MAVKIIDGNDLEVIVNIPDQLPLESGKPSMILCKTIKAKGLSFGENKVEFHFWNADLDLLNQAERA